ncbi:MAG: glycosyltransferase, partial [Pseudomonadota bacterium]
MIKITSSPLEPICGKGGWWKTWVLLSALAGFVILWVQKSSDSNFLPLPKLECVSYEPIVREADLPVSEDQILAQLKILRGITTCVRIYSLAGGRNKIPKIAKELGMKIILGAWLGKDPERNRLELNNLSEILRSPEQDIIKLVVVGNEVRLYNLLPQKTLIDAILMIKAQTNLPVTTAEVRDIWLNERALGKVVDRIGLNSFAYWDGISNKKAPEHIIGQLESLHKAFNKPIDVLELGWPTEGVDRGKSVVGLKEQRRYLTEVIALLRNNYFYNVLGGFDSPWKIFETDEGRTGQHWGLLDRYGQSKTPVIIPYFRLAFCLLCGLILIYLFTGLRATKRSDAIFLSSVYLLSLLGLLAVMFLTGRLSYATTNFGFVAVSVISIIFLITPLTYWVYLCTSFLFKIRDDVAETSLSPMDGKVSIHIPCRNENPQIVIATIRSCLTQTYQDIKIIVIDNNTEDPQLWKPVEAFACNEPKVRFYHYPKLSGYKAGALNKALELTHPATVAVAVLDADYIARSEWIESSLKFLSDKVWFVQSPQDYRLIESGFVERILTHEMRATFMVGVSVRAMANAMILHGTVCLINRDAFGKVGGWNENCIVEDAELGIRILKAKKSGVFIPQILGQGIAPQDFMEATRQRFRWVFGSMQILRSSWKEFIPGLGENLSLSQKMHFILAWLTWWNSIFYPLALSGTVGLAWCVLCMPSLVPVFSIFIPLFF